MSRKIRIGIQLHPQHTDFATLRANAVKSEELGADIVFNWDHFYPLYGEADGAHFEAWTMLGAWAEATESIEIGCLVTCNSYRNANLLADMARTVDHASGGRLIFGIGSGWFERDYNEYGFEFGTAVGRLHKLDEAMPIIRERWTKLNPAPLRDIPILIGGGGEKITLRIVAEHADIWHGFFNPKEPETYSRKQQVLTDWCAKAGRDPAEIERSVGVNPAKLEQGDAVVAAGAEQITLGFDGPGFDAGLVAEWIAWRDERNLSS